jgi:hypothetical protein
MAEKLIAQTLASTRSLDETGDIDKLDMRRNDLMGMDQLREAIKPAVGDRNGTFIRLYCAERVIFVRGMGAGKCVKNGRLPHVREADYPNIHYEGLTSTPGHAACSGTGVVSPQGRRDQLRDARRTWN